MADNNPYMNPYYQQQAGAASGSSNPYTSNYYSSYGTSSSAPKPQVANAYEYDVGVAAQQSAYVPGANAGKAGGAGTVVPKGAKRKTVLRKGGGKLWEDQTLLEWDDSGFSAALLREVWLTEYVCRVVPPFRGRGEQFPQIRPFMSRRRCMICLPA